MRNVRPLLGVYYPDAKAHDPHLPNKLYGKPDAWMQLPNV